jgi:GAF domain-containing protein
VNAEGPSELGDLLECQTLVLELIARGETLYQVLDTLVRVIQLQCPGMLASILLLDPDGSHVRHGAAPDLPEDYVRAIDGLPIGPQAGSCGTAAFTRKPVIVGDIATDPLWKDYRAVALQNDLRACWSTPIFDSERRVLGTFAMYFRAPGLPSQSHLRLIDISTHIAAIAITKHRAEEEIRRRGR